MLYGILNAACDASRGNPPSERDINQVLAAVAGIGAKHEIEGVLATQTVATHTAIGANQTDDSYLLFLVAPAQAGAQGLRRSVGCPWVPAFAGMTKERRGTKR